MDAGGRATAPALLSAIAPCSTTSIHGGVPPVTHMDVVTAKAMLEHRWPSMQLSARPTQNISVSTLMNLF